MAWIFPKVDVGHDGWAYVHGADKIVLHTTESNAGSIGGVEGWYRQKSAAGSPLHPHITADPSTRTVHQHIDTERACYALKNNPGGVHTNGARAINIEIVGRAAETGSWPVEWFEWLGRAVIAPIVRAHPTIDPANTPTSGWPPSPSGYGVNTRWRMTAGEWLNFNGVCGHVHVPEGNSHSDPGAINIAAVTTAALAELGRVTDKPPKDDDVVTVPLPPGALPDDRLTTNSPGLTVDERTRAVQTFLNDLAARTSLPGFLVVADGQYGPRTAAAVDLAREAFGMLRWYGEWDSLVATSARHWQTVAPAGGADPAVVDHGPAVATSVKAALAAHGY